ncbi:MAG: DUF3971 domain-containing protein [Rickettsiales bacterium]|jgi:hypothetical protein|nr:DUF3971 domain-containing protein [Rickettsiales bacterium]
MRIIIKLLRNVTLFTTGLALLLIIAMVSLNTRSFTVSNDNLQKLLQYYDNKLTIQTEGAKLIFLGKEIQLDVSSAKIDKNSSTFIKLKNLNLSFNLLSLDALAKLDLFDTEITNLISLNAPVEITSVIDNIIQYNYIVCDGKITISFGLFKDYQATLNLFSKTGWVDPQKNNLSKLDLKEFVLNLDYQLEKLSIKKIHFEYANSFKASFSGDFNLDKNNLKSAKFQTNISQLPINYLDGFWPRNISPNLQAWVTNNINNGIVTKVQGIFTLTEEDLQKDLPPKESINVSMKLKDMDLKYLEQYSPISQIDGILKIDGHGLYLDAETAETSGCNLKNIKLDIPFNNFTLSVKSQVNGDIANLNQFIPKNISDDLLNYNIDFPLIKGYFDGMLYLNFPIFEDFSFKSFKIDAQANINNVTLDTKERIKFKDGSFQLLNKDNEIKLKLNGYKNFSIEIDLDNESDRNPEGQINIIAEIDANKKLNFQDKISFRNGLIKPIIHLKPKSWDVELDFSDVDIYLSPLGYTKPKSADLFIKCSGDFNNKVIRSKSCTMNGKDISGDISFNITNDELTNLELKDFRIGPNRFDFQSLYKNKIYNYNLSAEYINLNDYSLGGNSSNNKNSFDYKIVFAVDKARMPNKNYLHDITGKIIQIGNNPIDIDFKAFADKEKISIVKSKKDNLTQYILHSKNASIFAQDFGIYQNTKKGEIWIKGSPKKTKNILSYHGTFSLDDFAFTNTSAFTKIILGVLSPLNSPEAVAQSLKGGSLPAESFDADWEFNNGSLEIKNARIKGPSYTIRFSGNINFKESTINIKGIYIPSAYGINSLVSDIPLVGSILSGGKDSALFGANFSVKGNLKDPKISFDTLTALTPGFIRNLFN